MRNQIKRFRLNPMAAAVAAALYMPLANAIPVVWNVGTSGTWSVAGNWSPLLPANGDDVTINRPETLTVTYNSGTVSLNTLTIGSAANTLAMTAGTLTTGVLSNAGIVTVSGGTLNFTGGNSGAMNFNGGTANLSGTLTINGAVRLAGGTLAGGTVQQAGANRLTFANSSNNTLSGVTVRGTLNVTDGAGSAGQTRISGGLTLLDEAGVNPGVMNIGTTAASTNSGVYFFGTQSINGGTINLSSATSVGFANMEGAGTLTLAAGTTLQGRGNVGGQGIQGGAYNLVNNGLISANLNAQTLSLANSGTLSNTGTLEARNGGVLSIAPAGAWSNTGLIKVVDATSTINLGGTITVGSLGTFDNAIGGFLNLTGTLNNAATTIAFTNATGSMRLLGGTVSGGTVQLSAGNGLQFSNSSNNVLSGVTVRGTLNIADRAGSAGQTRISGGLTLLDEAGVNPGVMNIGTTAASTNSGVYFFGTQSINGGTINLSSATSVGFANMEGAGTLTLAAGTTLQGRGNVGGQGIQGGAYNLVNNGLISANLNAQTLSLANSGTLSNTGTLEARNGGVLSIAPAGAWSNTGLIKVVDATSTINLGGTITVGSLGTFDNAIGGFLNLTGTLNNAATTIAFTNATGSMRLLGGTVSGGTVQLSAGNGLQFSNSSNNVLSGVTVRGTLNIADRAGSAGQTRISGGLTLLDEAGVNPGVMNIGTTAASTNSGVYFFGTQSINGGTINLSSATSVGFANMEGAGTLTLAAGTTLQGRGNVGGQGIQGGAYNLVNNGLISANLNAQTLSLANSGTLSNTGTLEARNGGVLSIAPAGAWSNTGLIKVVDATSTINLGGTITVGSLGTFDNAIGGFLNLTGTLNNAATTIAFTNATGSMRLLGGTVSGGTVQLSAGNGLQFSNSSNNVLSGVTVRGTLNIADRAGSAGQTRISGGLTLLDEAGVNPGVMNIGTTAASTNSGVYFFGTQSINGGTINLSSATSVGFANMEGAGTLTLAAGTTLQGRGNVGGQGIQGGAYNLVNNGLISANLNAQTLSLANSGTLSNTGTLEARNGGVLSIAPAGAWSNTGLIKVVDATSTINLGGTITVGSLGTFDNAIGGFLNLTGTLNNAATTIAFTNATGSMRLLGGTVSGGTVQLSAGNGLQFSNSSNNVLSGVTVRGTLNIADRAGSAGQTRISGGLTLLDEAGVNPGVMNIGTTAASTNSGVYFFGTQSINGGTINLSSATSVGFANMEGAGTLTLAAGTTLQGRGNVGGQGIQGSTYNLINNGLISANLNALTLSIGNNGALTNNGTFEALSGAVLSIANGSTSITNLSGGTLTGGIWRANAGAGAAGRIDFTAINTTISNNNADIYLVGANSGFQGRDAGNVVRTLDATLAVNSGALRLQQGRNFNATGNSGNFTNTGNLELTDSTFTSTTLASDGAITSFGNSTVTAGVGNRITGNGQINASFAPLTITRGVNMGAASAMNINPGATINLSGATLASQIGTLAQNGSLNLGAQNLVVLKDYNNADFGVGNSFNARAGVSGTGLLVGNLASQTITGSVIAGVPNQWTIDFGPVRGSGSGTVNFQIANNGSGADIRGAIVTSNIDARLSGTGVTASNFGAIAAGGNTGNLAVTLNGGNVGGPLTGTLQIVSNFSNVLTQTITLSGTTSVLAVGNATPNPTNLGNFRVGTAGGSTGLLVQNTTLGVGAEQLGINSATASSGFSAVNVLGNALIAPGGSFAGAVTVAANGTGIAGLNNGTVSLQYASDGTNVDPLFVRQAANLQVVAVQATGFNKALGSAAPVGPVALGNARINGTLAQTLTLSNTVASNGFGEDLNASFGGNTGAASNNGGVANGIVAGASNNAAMVANLSTTSAGAKTGSVSVNFQTAGAVAGVSNSLGTAAAGSQIITLNGGVFQVAQPTTPNSVNLGNVRAINGASSFIALSNTSNAPAGFQEGLAASFSGSTGGVNTAGSFANLAQGGSNNNTLSVGFAAGTAGARNGTATLALTSVGAGTSGLADLPLPAQVLNVSANFFRLATGAATPDPVNFGNVRVNGTAQQLLTVANTAAADGFSERLNASFSGNTGSALTAAGTITQLRPGTSNNSAMGLTLNTASAGAKSGTVTLAYASDGTGTTGVAASANGNQVINFSGAVFRLAQPNTIAPINFGNVLANSVQTRTLTVGNSAAADGFSEALNAAFGAVGGTNAASFSGAGAINGLVAGGSDNTTMVVTLNTSATGTKTANIQVLLNSNGTAIGNGLGITALPTQVINLDGVITGVVGNLASAGLNPTTVNFGKFREGAPNQTQQLTVSNLTVGPGEGLNASFGASSGGASNNAGSITSLATGGVNNTSMSVSLSGLASAGPKSGTQALNFVSDGTFNAGVVTPLPAQSVSLSAEVYRLASADGSSSVNLSNVRAINGASSFIALSNTSNAPAGFQEGLAASFSGSTGGVNTAGSFANLAQGGSNNNTLSVGFAAGTAGARNGTATLALTSVGAGTSGLADLPLPAQVLNVSANFFRLATGAATPDPVNFGNVRVNGTAQQLLTVANTAAADGFSERLNASFSGNTGSALTAAGTITQLRPGTSNNSAMGLTLNTASAGAKSGTVTLAYASDGTGTTGVAASANGNQVINFSGAVFRLAQPNTIAPINFGNVLANSVQTRTLTVGNSAAADGFSEALNAAFGAVGGTNAASFSGAGAINGLVAGGSDNTTMVVTLNTSATGTKTANIQVLLNSNGTAIGNGLGITALPTQVINLDGVITGVVGNLASAGLNPTTVNFGKFREGAPNQTQQLTVSNLTVGPGEGLNASFGASSGGASNNAGSITSLATGGVNNTSMSVSLSGLASAGPKSGTQALNFVSDGTFNAGVVTPLPAQSVSLSAEVYRLASASATSAVNLAARRVGEAAASGALSLNNSAATDGFSEGLRGSLGAAPAGFAVSGAASTALIAAGANEARTVSLSTANAGSFSGNLTIALVSNGAGTSGFGDAALADKTVALSGKVYTPAVGQSATPTLDFGVVRVGDTVSARNITINNTAAVTALNDTLAATLSGAAAPFSGGNVAGIAAQGSGQIGVGLGTSAAGVFNVNANLSFLSHNPDMADASAGANAGVNLLATINNLANADFDLLSGLGVLSQNGSDYVLDLGTINLGSSVLSRLHLDNDVLGPADDLRGNFDLSAADDFSYLGWDTPVGPLAAGQATGELEIDYMASTLGPFQDSIVFNGRGTNASDPAGLAQTRRLIIRANVIDPNGNPVPEPGSLALMLAAAVAGLIARRRRVH